MRTAKENLIYLSRHLRSVGQRWVCPADSLPLFFYNAVDEGWNTRNSTSPAESPMRGNNWRPTHSGGGERPTFFLLPSQNFIKNTKLSSRFYSAYTLLCAVLLERGGKPHAGRMCVAPLAWLVHRSNIAHNVSKCLCSRIGEHKRTFEIHTKNLNILRDGK